MRPPRRCSAASHAPGPQAAASPTRLVPALLGVGAFFARGPIGLGNGPLTFVSNSGATLSLAKHADIALVVPVGNPGKSAAVINGFTLVGGGKGYAAPKLV